MSYCRKSYYISIEYLKSSFYFILNTEFHYRNWCRTVTEQIEKHTIPDINKLSDIFLETLRDVKKSGNVLNTQNFAQFLSKKKLIRNLLKQANRPKEVSLKSEKKSKIEELQTVINEHEQKEKFIRKQLMDLLSELDNEKDINKRTVFTLLKMCDAAEQSSLQEALDSLKESFINEDDRQSRMHALDAINNQILKSDLTGHDNQTSAAGGDIEPDTKTMKRSMFGKLLGESSDFKLKSVKKACIKAVDDIRRIVGHEFNDQIALIKERIQHSEDLDYLLSLRKQAIELIESYADKNQAEKNEITKFIKEIGTKLVDMEREIYAVFSNTDDEIDEDIVFNEKMGGKIGDILKTIEKSTDFDNIKSIIMSGLHAISDTLNSKRTEYAIRLENSRKEQTKLQQYFKKVINSVIDQNKALIERNQKDPLTEIYNRPAFEELFAIEHQRYQRYRDAFSLVMFDIDHFKQVNDDYGHEAGDRVLRGIAKSVGKMLRETDVFARYGGEEFFILLPKTTISKSSTVAEKIREVIENTEFSYDNAKVPITISAGVTEVKADDNDFQTMFRRVDKLMYQAKNEGRNRVITEIKADSG